MAKLLNTLGAPPPLLVDRLETARLLNVSPGTVTNLIARGDLRSIKLGARRLIDRADILEMIAAKKGVRA